MTSEGDRREMKDVETDRGREGWRKLIEKEGEVERGLFPFLECSLDTVCCSEEKLGK